MTPHSESDATAAAPLPEGVAAMDGLGVMAAVAVVGLPAAAWRMRRESEA